MPGQKENTVKKGDLLFVYGTLRVGESNDLTKFEDSTPAGKTRINGLLYNLGWFPGVKLTEGASLSFLPGEPTVTGDVFEIGSAKLVDRLDSYESYPSLYNRVQVDTEDGRTVWVYTYNYNVSEDQRLHSGDWCEAPSSKCSRIAEQPKPCTSSEMTAAAPVAA